MRRFEPITIVILLTMLSSFAFGTTPTADEIKQASEWTANHLDPSRKVMPFSFVYDGKRSVDLLAVWPMKVDSKQLDKSRIQRTFTWIDDKSQLEVRCVAVEYSDFPVVEWTAYFRNRGNENTPIIEKIQAINFEMQREKGTEFVLHNPRGDFNFPESYQPFDHMLWQNTTLALAPVGGRPTNSSFPYFNLQMPGGGMIMAVGWPGQWSTRFKRDGDRGLHICAGQELTHLFLKPGEEIRTPLIAMLFWQGTDLVRAQNLWRRWMLAHSVPRPGGKLPLPLYVFCDGGFMPGLKTSEPGEKEFIDTLARQNIRVDYWWIDAGWYPCDDQWWKTGTWEPDPERYPHGIKAVSDYVHGRGMKLVVWFEPERVTKGSWLAQNRPQWLLGGTLLNLGNPETRRWITDRVDSLIREQGIDLYRQDFNMDPLEYWQKNDSPDRQGITENLHVQGYLAYWDELRRRHPDMLIDSCASGGRRNDLETMRRAVPLLRSDYQGDSPEMAPGNQGHTYGLSSWIPYYGTGVYYTPRDLVYCVRSYMSPAFGIAVDVRKPGVDWNLYRRLVGQWRQVADRMLGDYYPLTPYTLQNDRWIGWQFDRPEQGDGMIQAFRRAKSPEASMRLRLLGLDRAALYKVTDIDVGTPKTIPGRDLVDEGVAVEIKDQPGAAVLTYSKLANH